MLGPRLRSMVLDDTRTVLVLDRWGPLTPERAVQITAQAQAMAERVGLAGALLFSEAVDLEGDAPADAPAVSDEVLRALSSLQDGLAVIDSDARAAGINGVVAIGPTLIGRFREALPLLASLERQLRVAR